MFADLRFTPIFVGQNRHSIWNAQWCASSYELPDQIWIGARDERSLQEPQSSLPVGVVVLGGQQHVEQRLTVLHVPTYQPLAVRRRQVTAQAPVEPCVGRIYPPVARIAEGSSPVGQQ